MLPKLILCESSLRKDQKTYFNHSHISNIRGVTIKNIWENPDRYGTIPTAMGPTSLQGENLLYQIRHEGYIVNPLHHNTVLGYKTG